MSKSLGNLIGRQLRTSAGKADSRKRLIIAVRAAARRTGMTDDDRRALQAELTGKSSMTDMTLAEIGKVLDHLNRDRPAPMAHRAHIGKIKALWWSLYWLGAIDQPNEAALDGFVKRQTGMASLRFVDHRAAPALIEAMKAMAVRAGVTWPTEAGIADVARRLDHPVDQAQGDRIAVLVAVWDKLIDLNQVVGGYPPYLAAALKLSTEGAPWQWTSHELDAAIRLLGKKLRRAMDKRRAE